MKTFKASQLATKPAEVFAEARKEGAIVQQCRTNGEVIEEFVILGKAYLLEILWNNYSSGDRNNDDICDLIDRIDNES